MSKFLAKRDSLKKEEQDKLDVQNKVKLDQLNAAFQDSLTKANIPAIDKKIDKINVSSVPLDEKGEQHLREQYELDLNSILVQRKLVDGHSYAVNSIIQKFESDVILMQDYLANAQIAQERALNMPGIVLPHLGESNTGIESQSYETEWSVQEGGPNSSYSGPFNQLDTHHGFKSVDVILEKQANNQELSQNERKTLAAYDALVLYHKAEEIWSNWEHDGSGNFYIHKGRNLLDETWLNEDDVTFTNSDIVDGTMYTNKAGAEFSRNRANPYGVGFSVDAQEFMLNTINDAISIDTSQHVNESDLGPVKYGVYDQSILNTKDDEGNLIIPQINEMMMEEYTALHDIMMIEENAYFVDILTPYWEPVGAGGLSDTYISTLTNLKEQINALDFSNLSGSALSFGDTTRDLITSLELLQQEKNQYFVEIPGEVMVWPAVHAAVPTRDTAFHGGSAQETTDLEGNTIYQWPEENLTGWQPKGTGFDFNTADNWQVGSIQTLYEGGDGVIRTSFLRPMDWLGDADHMYETTGHEEGQLWKGFPTDLVHVTKSYIWDVNLEQLNHSKNVGEFLKKYDIDPQSDIGQQLNYIHDVNNSLFETHFEGKLDAIWDAAEINQ